ncbi:hypothetical protein Bca101_081408 [Brassica carinata]
MLAIGGVWLLSSALVSALGVLEGLFTSEAGSIPCGRRGVGASGADSSSEAAQRCRSKASLFFGSRGGRLTRSMEGPCGLRSFLSLVAQSVLSLIPVPRAVERFSKGYVLPFSFIAACKLEVKITVRNLPGASYSGNDVNIPGIHGNKENLT